MRRTCTKCHAQFDARGDWQKLCWECWRKQKDAEQLDDEYGRGFDAGFRAGRDLAGRRSVSALDPEPPRSVIALCHPDRHPPERFQEANRGTSALLELRRSA